MLNYIEILHNKDIVGSLHYIAALLSGHPEKLLMELNERYLDEYGENAFTHGSGIHQHGVFMNPVTYESYPPELVGRRRRVYIDELVGVMAFCTLRKGSLE